MGSDDSEGYEDAPTQAVAVPRLRPGRLPASPPGQGPRGTGPPPVRRPVPRPLDDRVRRRGLRYRVLPRTLLGTTAFILAFAMGAGFSGVVLYSYYQYRLNQTNQRVDTVINGYQKQFDNAQRDLANTANQARSQIQTELAPVENLEGDPAAEAALVKKVAPSTYFVHTLDSSGEASVGSAFVVTSNSTQSLLLTSYTTVAAAIHSPGPPVYVRQGSTDTQVTIRTWDATDDLALIVLPTPDLPALPAAPASPLPTVGEKVYAVSGLGSAGASISEGSISDVAAAGLADTAPIGPQFQGGPIVDSAGQVIAVASRTFAPLGFSTDSVWYAPYLQAACTKVLSCPGGTFPTSR